MRPRHQASRLPSVAALVALLQIAPVPTEAETPSPAEPHVTEVGESAQRPARPSHLGRRGRDPKTGEYFRAPTARDDLGQRLPVEFMPAAASAEELAATGLSTSEASSTPRGTVLLDNGVSVDCDYCGAGGAAENRLRDLTADRQTLGFGHQARAGGRLADDFTVDDPAGWTVRDILLFAYQTGSSIRSTITTVNVNIWSGAPGQPGSKIVWDGGAAHRLTDSRWTGLYLVAESSSGATNRPIMENTFAANTTLAPGVYWLDWQADGRLDAGPWTPSLPGPGNALQSLDGGATWRPATDAGSGETAGFPFVIRGSSGMEGTGPAIHLRMGVGPNCSQSEVVAAPGAEVCYSHSMFNIGDTTFQLHDLVDDQLGILLDAEAIPVVPGAGIGLTDHRPIHATATNTATWTAYNTGPSDETTDQDSTTVFVANAQPLWCNGGWSGFEPGIPADWTVVNSIALGPVFWTTIAGCGEADNYAGPGNAACASSDLQGGGSGLFDTSLVSTAFSLSATSSASLLFNVNYQSFLGQDRLDVDISSDQGGSWTNLASYSDDIGTFRGFSDETVVLDLSAWAGEPYLLLRWRYYDLDASFPQDDWYVQIDEVRVVCNHPAGGFRACRYPNAPIPEFPSSGISDTIVLDSSWGTIRDLDVLVRVDHDYVGDLTGRLTVQQAAGGRNQVLFDRPGAPFGAPPGSGCAGDDVYAIVDDEGTDGVFDTTCEPSSPTIYGNLVGDNPLSHFDGVDSGGQWVLTLEDNATGVTGTFEEWCLFGTACDGTLSHDIITYAATIEDCGTLTVGPFLRTRPGSGQVTLRAATGVIILNGVTIEGELAVELDPSLAVP